jgi:ribonuclease BN (tRNA processing enzyme)
MRPGDRQEAGLLLLLSACLLLLAAAFPLRAQGTCGGRGVSLQVLGSGGPELDDGRASSAYLLWQGGRARVLVDIGPGSLLHYDNSGARVEDLDYLLLTHLHVDHSAALPALVKGAYFTGRDRDLPVYGPRGNDLMPDTSAFVQALFGGEDGAFRYLGDYLDGSAAFRLLPHDISVSRREVQVMVERPDMKLSTIAVHHGPVPALAWRLDTGDSSIVITGDMNGAYGTLEKLASGADLLIAHHAVSEGAVGAARNLHMPPSVIGAIAAKAGVKRLVLSHRMRRTLGLEAESERHIRAHYRGELIFAEDGQCFHVPG